MSSLSTQLNPAVLDELCAIELHISKSNGKGWCTHCNKSLTADQHRFELKIKPKTGSLLKIGESMLFHITCWLNESNEHKKHTPFNYKTCIGWNKLKRTIQNDILRVNAGYPSLYETIEESNHEDNMMEPPTKKRKLSPQSDYKSKKKNFKPPRTKREKQFQQKQPRNLRQNRISNQSISEDIRNTNGDLEGNVKQIKNKKALTKDVGIQKRVTNANPIDQGIQCQILYTADQGTQTMPQHLDLDGFHQNMNRKSEVNHDSIPWDVICSENKIETEEKLSA
eukprot:64415_1